MNESAAPKIAWFGLLLRGLPRQVLREASMSLWLVADVVLLLAVVPCAIIGLRAAGLSDWVVAVQMCGVIGALALMILAEAMSRPSFYDLAVALSLLSFPSGLVFAHFLERWLP